MGNAPKKKAETKNTQQQLEERMAHLKARSQEEFDARVEEATEVFDALEETITQREWLLITARLDRTRAQIAADGSLRLLAVGWVKEKREHGGASWDVLLEMTDKDLARLHGFPDETPEETTKRLEKAASLPDPEAPDLEPEE